MNEELIRQYTREAYRSAYGRDIPPHNDIGKFAKALLELHHARAVAPLVEVAEEYMAADGEVDATVCNPLFAKRSDLDARDAAVERKRRAFGQLRTALAPFQQEAKHDQL